MESWNQDYTISLPRKTDGGAYSIVLERSGMTETLLSSATREVRIGFDRPFVIIGERINPTGRKILAEEMKNGDFSRVEADVLAQVAAGAHMLDVNAGIPLADEPAILAEAVLPLVARYGAAVVAISNDETGISEDPDVRFEVAKMIVERAADFGIPREDVVVDPLVMPIGAINSAGKQVTHIVRRLRDELKVNTTCGASNVSFGLPNRNGINSAFLTMAISAGLTSAITNPLHSEVMQAVLGADVMMGNDPDCRQWISKYRKLSADNATRGRGGRRRRRQATNEQ